MNSQATKFSKLLILTSLSLFSGLVFSLLSLLIISFLYNIPFSEVSSSISVTNINKTKLMLFFNSLGLFVLPAIFYVWVQKKSIIPFFNFKKDQTLLQLPILIVLFLVSMPLINLSSELNNYLKLPSFLNGLESWMREAEDNAMIITKALLEMNGLADLFINILLIGVLPAVGEELIFRGVIQKILTKNSKNYHIGIWLSAILFSAIHFQFYGFLPRMLLGAYFGYLLYWSKNIWLPIFAHFVNNTMAVLAAYYFGASSLENDFETIGTTQENFIVSIISILVFYYVFSRLKKTLINHQPSSYST